MKLIDNINRGLNYCNHINLISEEEIYDQIIFYHMMNNISVDKPYTNKIKFNLKEINIENYIYKNNDIDNLSKKVDIVLGSEYIKKVYGVKSDTINRVNEIFTIENINKKVLGKLKVDDLMFKYFFNKLEIYKDIEFHNEYKYASQAWKVVDLLYYTTHIVLCNTEFYRKSNKLSHVETDFIKNNIYKYKDWIVSNNHGDLVAEFIMSLVVIDKDINKYKDLINYVELHQKKEGNWEYGNYSYRHNLHATYASIVALKLYEKMWS